MRVEEGDDEHFHILNRMFYSMIRDWDTNPVKPGDSCEDASGRYYRVVASGIKDFDIKTHCMIQASNYYGTYDYQVLRLERVTNAPSTKILH